MFVFDMANHFLDERDQRIELIEGQTVLDAQRHQKRQYLRSHNFFGDPELFMSHGQFINSYNSKQNI